MLLWRFQGKRYQLETKKPKNGGIIPPLSIYPELQIDSDKYTNVNLHSSTVHNNQKAETAQMSSN